MSASATKTELEHYYFDTNGVTLHVVQAGPKDGEPVILLHGFPEFWYGWHKQIDALAQAGFRVTAPDQRGYNLSSKPSAVEAYRVRELVADIIGLIDVLGYETVNLVGHDWGGVVAWTLAMRHPERFKKLGILNIPHPSVFARTLRTDRRQQLKSWYTVFFQLPLLPEWLLTGGDANGAALLMFNSSNPGTFTDADIAEYVKAWKRPGAMTGMLNWYRAVGRKPDSMLSRTDDKRDTRIHMPTLMIWGTNDIALDASMAQPSIDMCDDGRLVTFSDAGHWIAHEKPEEVNRLLIDFFSPAPAAP
ncbi:MAG: alpha/beta hydrolase [bacterium]|nr:alpha/beta hydrolase [bacterium]